MSVVLEKELGGYATHRLFKRFYRDYMITTFHLMLTPLQVLKKETQEFVPRSYWDMLRRGASQALFSDLAEVQPKPSVILNSSHGFYLSHASL